MAVGAADPGDLSADISAGSGLPTDFESGGDATDVEAAEAADSGEVQDGQTAVDGPVEAQTPESASEEAASDSEEELDQVDTDSKLGNRAKKRIQQLASQKNELTEQLTRMQADYNRQLQWMQQRFEYENQARSQEQARQTELAQKQLDMLRERHEREEYEKLPLGEQLKLDAVKKSKSEFESLLESRLSPLQQQLEQERQLRAQVEAQTQKKARFDVMTAQINEAKANLLFNGFDPADQNSLASEMDEMLLSYAAGHGKYPKDAAPGFKKFLDRYAAASNKAKAKVTKTQVAKTQGLPASGTKRSPSAVGGNVKHNFRSLKELREKTGYSDFVEYYAAQTMGQ